jgi:hypothetical protein
MFFLWNNKLGIRDINFNCKGIKLNFKLIRDVNDFASAIAYGEIYILHLNPGSSRNESMADELVKYLNKEISLNKLDSYICEMFKKELK